MTATCPHCGKPASVDETNASRPFCSERCRTLDLGAWLTGKYAIPGEPVADATLPGEEDDPPPPRRH